MVKIRLMRVGKKHAPAYRIVATDSHSPRDGRFLEILGWYNPLTSPPTIQMKEDRVTEWMLKGAQISDAMEHLFRITGYAGRWEEQKATHAAAKA